MALAKSIKKILKEREGLPVKLKKLVKLLEKEGLDEEVTKKTVKAACADLKKVHVEDGMAWFGKKSDDAETADESKVEEKPAKKKRKAEEEEAEEEEEEEDTKRKKKKKKK